VIESLLNGLTVLLLRRVIILTFKLIWLSWSPSMVHLLSLSFELLVRVTPRLPCVTTVVFDLPGADVTVTTLTHLPRRFKNSTTTTWPRSVIFFPRRTDLGPRLVNSGLRLSIDAL